MVKYCEKEALLYVLAVFLNQPLLWYFPKSNFLFTWSRNLISLKSRTLVEADPGPLPPAKIELFVTIVYECILLHLKSSFRSQDTQIFIFLTSPQFPLGHCFRGWLKINFKVYGIISCLKKNLITHFVWYLEKEKRYDIETLSIDRVLNKEHLYKKAMQKMCTKSQFQTSF